MKDFKHLSPQAYLYTQKNEAKRRTRALLLTILAMCLASFVLGALLTLALVHPSHAKERFPEPYSVRMKAIGAEALRLCQEDLNCEVSEGELAMDIESLD